MSNIINIQKYMYKKLDHQSIISKVQHDCHSSRAVLATTIVIKQQQ